MTIRKIKERLEFWYLYYRQETIWFVIGFITGAIIW